MLKLINENRWKATRQSGEESPNLRERVVFCTVQRAGKSLFEDCLNRYGKAF